MRTVPTDILIRSAPPGGRLPAGPVAPIGAPFADAPARRLHLRLSDRERTQVLRSGAKVSLAAIPSTTHVIEIEDQGIGMSEEEMTQANQRLAEPPAVDLALSQRVGLHVVARLAKRHSIRVQLRHSWYGGVVALILLPNDILVRPLGTSAPPDPERLASHLAGTPPGRVAVLDPPKLVVPPTFILHAARRHLGTDDLLPPATTPSPAWPAPNAGTDLNASLSASPHRVPASPGTPDSQTGRRPPSPPAARPSRRTRRPSCGGGAKMSRHPSGRHAKDRAAAAHRAAAGRRCP